MELHGKTILLTGASSGIGRELSRQLAGEGVKLALLARRDDLLLRLADELKNSGSEILPLRCDITRLEEAKTAYREIQSQFGPLDIAIFNAGLSYRAPVEQFRVDAGRAVFDVNVFGMLNFFEELLPDFRHRREGVVVGVSSLADCRGFPERGFYNASKVAAAFLLESLRIELKKDNVKVVTVKPGFVRTAMTKENRYFMPFLMSAARAAAIIIRGIKMEKRTIQFPLPTVLAAKLLKTMPDFLFEMIGRRIEK
jgi:short-subunit dehydrogenase